MREDGHSASRAQVEKNLAAKRQDSRFVSDIEPLLRPGTAWDGDTAMNTVLTELVSRLPGEPRPIDSHAPAACAPSLPQARMINRDALG